MSKLLYLFFLGIIAIINCQKEAIIDPSKTYQTIRGFGGINHRLNCSPYI